MTTNRTLPAMIASVLALPGDRPNIGHAAAEARLADLTDAILNLTASPEDLVRLRSVFGNMLSFSHEHDPNSDDLGIILDAIDECLRACDPSPADAEMRLTFGHFN